MALDTSSVLGATTPVFDDVTLWLPNHDLKIDLAQYITYIKIYEDIFSPVLTGQIRIYDSVNLLNRMPIVGNEQITIKVYSSNYNETENDDLNFLHRTFDINKITNIVDVNDYTKEYTLHFASPELRRSESLKLSKGFKNKRLSEVVDSVLTSEYFIGQEQNGTPQGLGFPYDTEFAFEYKPVTPTYLPDVEKRYKKIDKQDSIELFIEKTLFDEPVVSFPYLRPLEVISWICDRSIRSSRGRSSGIHSEAANFLFFENKRGFQFCSIDTLLENKDSTNMARFKYGNAVQNITKNREITTQRIEELQVQNCYDILQNIRRGVYASKLVSYDIATGNMRELDYNYLDSFQSTESTERNDQTEDFPMIAHDDITLSESYLASRHFIVNSPYPTVDPFTCSPTDRRNDSKALSGQEEYLQNRLSQIGRLSNYRAVFNIPANSKHKVGDLIEIDIKDLIPSENAMHAVEEPNKYYSGYYLISCIEHSITKTEYKMNIEAIKDASRNRLTS